MKEMTFQFQKHYCSAVSWEIYIDTKIPLEAPKHLIVPNRKVTKKKKYSSEYPKNLVVQLSKARLEKRK